ncbi:hypothetical protein [Chitinophaga flava]|uniref:Uncharacterized protein n=1 Tax=Chitinophaga flava TaxID=2259036 RepID=A0A365XXG3_9BACT|nr:hypothetical protein [Chitinophaga flava]RBL90394.1 hypothetical protein DF182_28440 [Chitinophaga flava]
MKALSCILIAILLLSATPASVEKKVTTRRSNVTVRVWFFHQGDVIPLCNLPVFWPRVYIWGVRTIDMNCPSYSIVVDVAEGQTISAAASMSIPTYVVASYPLVVTADMIGAGAIDLIIDI